MIHTPRATRAMAVAPHAAAAQSALAVLREHGNAIEATVAAAATIATVYPHMTGIGGDAFWLIHEPGRPVRALDACGAAAARATREFYRERGCRSIPTRGALAANTVAGTVSGWQLALELSREQWDGRLPLARLLEDAIHYAEHGIVVTKSQAAATRAKLAELAPQPGFAAHYAPGGNAPAEGSLLRQTALGASLRALARRGAADFYSGELARTIAADLATLGSPLAAADLASHRAAWREPLALDHGAGRVYNMPPPTQGLIALLILGILDRLGLDRVPADTADYVHLVVEATKQAFLIRDRHLTDPRYMKVDAQALLAPDALGALARNVDRDKALPWTQPGVDADTIWLGAVDHAGRAVSFIQSVYHEFGSGVVLAQTGINWQNRGASFSLEPGAVNALEPGRKPFHTLNPALAAFKDGRVMVYGTMGGDGQPQTQAAVFTRYALYGQALQQAVSAPRWLFGRNWGQQSATLKLESRFGDAVVASLKARGHDIEMFGDFDEVMGHAGAIVRHPSGVLEGAADPRSDGAAAGY
ncbi:MAG TPA: gamma-glutamyltransferase [Burkholderiales bacterium]|nr:gamma-glutamyltransferase [Burkholderiales bacterium]